MEPKKYAYIDSLRGIAILLVLIVHNGTCLHFPKVLNRIVENGQYGVQLFFLVSAFTLMLSYNVRKNEQGSVRNFFIRRFFRIAPMYYLALIYYLFQEYIGFQYFQTGEMLNSIPWSAAFSNIFFIHGIRPEWMNSVVPGGWTITIEMTFYAMLPVICKYITNINKCLILLFSSLAIRIFLNYLLIGTDWDTNYFLYFYFPNQFPIFLLGILAYFIIKEGTSGIKNGILLLFSFIILIYSIEPSPLPHLICGLSFFILLIVVSRKNYKLIVNPFMVYIGKISYSIYLVHFAVLYWMEFFHLNKLIPMIDLKTGLVNYVLKYAILLICSSIIAHFTYTLIEKPFQNIGKKIVLKFTNLNYVRCSN
jgi:peptidoglycan/LPS O-acetylase OafA/YrhL